MAKPPKPAPDPSPHSHTSQADNVSTPAPATQTSTHVLAPGSGLQYTPCTVRLDQLDAQTKRNIYCYRDGDSMKWDDDPKPDNLRSLGESLLAEGQLTPVEFFREAGTDADGNEVTRNILVRGYRVVEALQQLVHRRSDPERFHAGMELKAVEIGGGAEVDYIVRAVASNEVRCALSLALSSR